MLYPVQSFCFLNFEIQTLPIDAWYEVMEQGILAERLPYSSNFPDLETPKPLTLQVSSSRGRIELGL